MKRCTIAFTCIALLIGGIVTTLWVGSELTKPKRVDIGAPPDDLDARPIELVSPLGTPLRGWHVKGRARKGAILLLHGVRADRRSMIDRARFLKRHGYSLLLLDLQAHGESGGEHITFGARESKDVEAAVAMLRKLTPGQPLAVIGVSLGGASVTLSEASYAFDAIVLESVYPTIEDAISNRLRLHLGPAGPLLEPLLTVQLNARLDVKPSQLQPIEKIGTIRAPILIVHGAEDKHTTLEEAKKLFAAARMPKEFLTIPGAGHVDLHAYDNALYEQHIIAFLRRHMTTAR